MELIDIEEDDSVKDVLVMALDSFTIAISFSTWTIMGEYLDYALKTALIIVSIGFTINRWVLMIKDRKRKKQNLL